MKSNKKIILGVGSGRCGTLSLAVLLDLQKDSKFTHERPPLMPFEPCTHAYDAKKKQILELEDTYVGDVASSLIGYTEWFIEDYPNIKIVCLKRNKKECIESFLRKTKGRNNFQYGKEERTIFCITSPDYSADITKREAVDEYYNDYYRIAEFLEKDFPNNFKIFNTEDLNTHKGVSDILEFCEFKDKTISIGLQFNETKK